MSSHRRPGVRAVNLIGAAFLLLIGWILLANWTVEYLWFDALGHVSVFWTLRLLKLGLFLGVSLIVFAYLWFNGRLMLARLDMATLRTRLAYRIGTSPPPAAPTTDAAGNPGGTQADGWLTLLLAFIAVIFGLSVAAEWDRVLRLLWAAPYGEADPIYGLDIGFYLFTLPCLELMQDTLLVATLLVSTLLFAGYGNADRLRLDWPGGLQAPPAVRWHVTVNITMFLLVLAWGFYLDRYELLRSAGDAVYGMGYTDVHIRRPALWVMVAATGMLAVGLLLPDTYRDGPRLVRALGAYVGVWFVAQVLVPVSVQGFRVEPNELELETPYLHYNIALTRKAYGLERIDERSYAALDGLTPAALVRNRSTLDNIRLWDWRPLSQTFRQLQRIRTYYEFGDVDVDRYRVDDAYRQVLLATRELSDRLPAKAETWVNRRLQYTHGYGLAMSLAAEKERDGSPVLIVKDLPPDARGGLAATQPAIYYGERSAGHRIVNTRIPEFDHPAGDRNVYTTYTGRGGLPIDAAWKRLLFAWHRFDANILLTTAITPQSRLQLWRRLQERIARLAPFLRLDNDPYAVLDDGRVYWIQDAYTLARAFPYSQPVGEDFNYIRNSVKVVVDAYEGSVDFYVADPDDAVLAAYRRALPHTFRPLASMPPGLRRHLRYPQDLFAAQVAVYNTYHVTIPQVFYNGEDLWTQPWEKYGGEQIRMRPYYILMTLPGEGRLEFLLMTPLTPNNRDNMIAWFAARCDFPDYGELLVFKLPKERLVLGPIQVEAMIDQDTLISQQLSLWDQRGSRVLRGNLLVIPIEQSFLYVEPVYLIAEEFDIPQLKRVIVSNGKRLAMEPTLEAALRAVFVERAAASQPPPPRAETGLNDEARRAIEAAETALKRGDWEAFGQAMQALKALVGKGENAAVPYDGTDDGR